MKQMLDEAFSSFDFDKTLILSVSGGRDSTAMALALWDYTVLYPDNYDIRLLYETTGFNKSKATATVKRLAKNTGWHLDIVKYQGDKRPIQILKESFRAIPKALKIIEEGDRKTYKKVFACCKHLKKKPAKLYIKKSNPDKVIIAIGFKIGDKALHRYYRMKELVEWNTYFRTKVNGYTYFYPLRDCQEKDIDTILRNFGYGDTESSGCWLCPIFCVAKWHKKDPESDIKSRVYARGLGIEFPDSEQLTLRESCTKQE